MSDRAIELASRYLEGDDDAGRELVQLVRTDPDAKQTVAFLFRQHATLRWIHAEGAGAPGAAAPSGRSWWGWAAASAILLAVAAVLLLRRVPPLAALAEVENAVWVDREQQTIAAPRGMELRPGDVLRTDDSASARIRYAADATFVEVRSGSRVQLLASDPGKRLEILEGTLQAEVAAQTPDRPLRLASRQAEVRVLSGQFTVAAEEGRTRVEVDRGTLMVYDRREAREIEVQAGSYVVSAPGVEFRASPIVVEVFAALRNGGFEAGDLSGWGDRERARRMEISVGPEYRHGGQNGVRLVGPGGFDQRIETVPGKTYHVGAWARIERVEKPPTWGGIRIAVYPEGEGQSRWKPIRQYKFLTTARELPNVWEIVELHEWRRVRFTFVATSLVTTLRYDHFTDGSFESWADDLIVSPDPIPD